MKPGEYLLDLAAGPIEANVGRKSSRILVKNTGDRPIQVGSHYHFFEANVALSFERKLAFGMRLNIASGTAIRFEPGEEKEIELTDYAGRRIIHGFHALVEGVADNAESRAESYQRAREAGFIPDEERKKQ